MLRQHVVGRCKVHLIMRRHTLFSSCLCVQLEGASFALLLTAFCLTLVFLYFWSQAQNDYNDFDWWVRLNTSQPKAPEWDTLHINKRPCCFHSQATFGKQLLLIIWAF